MGWPRGPDRFSRSTNEQGFTLVEVIVALALTGTLLLVVWAAASGGMWTAGRIGAAVSRNIEMAQIDRAVRDLAQRVAVPYWAKAPRVQTTSSRMRFSFLDGDPDAWASFSFDDGSLVLDDGKSRLVFRGIETASFSFDDRPAGTSPPLEIILRIRGGKNARIVAPFGTSPFPLVGE